MTPMVFVPLDRARARMLRAGEALGDLTGHTATDALLQAHGYDESTLEDAEYAALSYAGVLAVLSLPADPLRLVLAAGLAPVRLAVDHDDPYGQVTVHSLRWSDVQALFADESEARPAIETARRATEGHSLRDALDLPGVESLLDDHDLLWFSPDELDTLP